MSEGKPKNGMTPAANEPKMQPTSDKKDSAFSANSAKPVTTFDDNSMESSLESEFQADKVQIDNKSVQANTHAKARKFRPSLAQKRWVKIVGVSAGSVAIAAIIAAGGLGQFYKTRIMPNVYVAGVNAGAKKENIVRDQLEKQLKQVKIAFKFNQKTLEPKLEEIGFQANVNKTLENAKKAKRNNGFLDKLIFWKRVDIPASVSVNDTLLNQYLETNIPEIVGAPIDAQLQFNAKTTEFLITEQSDGKAVDVVSVKRSIQKNAYQLTPITIKVGSANKAPQITKPKLEPLVKQANDLSQQKIILEGLGLTYQAKPSEIAAWLTPTPQKDGTVKLIVDSAKIQSYVEGISKRISSIPVDRKVINDEATGAEVILQEGRDGTELSDKEELSETIARALKNKVGTTQTMNIQTAAFKTVNMSSYDKWIEVDLSEQRMRAYEHTTLLQNYLIASGTRGRDTPVGEFSIWLKTRKQTMQGGSKADGNYYSIPNVEWVSYFYKDYALHGAWWRKVFGYPASHGCVNMTNEQAQWLYEWAPIGTKVIVHQ